MTTKLFAYSNSSNSARRISESLGIRRLRHQESTWRPTPLCTVINWGHSGSALDSYNCNIINLPSSVRLASNKLSFFRHVEGNNDVTIPPFTTEIDVAREWIASNNEVVIRTVLNGHSGEGIIIAKTLEELVPANLYTKYIPKRAEYRIHVCNGEIIDRQRKIKDPDREAASFHVRSHANGFIFARNDLVLPAMVEPLALAAIEAVGLHFGAVDIIYNERHNTAYVLEINTSPGLEGQTLTSYINAFRRYI